MTDVDVAPTSSPADQALPIGTTLADGQFTITGHLGAGGFGKTYKATDNTLGRTIVLKECFPEDFCFRHGQDVVARTMSYAKPFRSIVEMSMREARSLAKLRHPNVVGVHRAFEENETAYLALDLIDGQDFLSLIRDEAAPLPPARVRNILVQLLDAIEQVHALDLLHRDIAPDNIIIETSGAPVLIDFGAARGDASRRTRAVSTLVAVKDGYSPHEFYVAGSEQTASSDLYALAATFYHVLTGAPPPDSQTRMVEIAGRRPDPCTPLAGRVDGYDAAFLEAIDTAMAIHPGDRLQSAGEWRARIVEPGSVSTRPRTEPAPAPAPVEVEITPELKRSLTRLVEETNSEVRKSGPRLAAKPKPPAPPRPEPWRPDWIEEFNRESLAAEAEAAARAAAEAEAQARAEEEAAAAAALAAEVREGNDTQLEFPARETDLAAADPAVFERFGFTQQAEKPNRIRSRSRKELASLAAKAKWRIRSTVAIPMMEAARKRAEENKGSAQHTGAGL